MVALQIIKTHFGDAMLHGIVVNKLGHRFQIEFARKIENGS